MRRFLPVLLVLGCVLPGCSAVKPSTGPELAYRYSEHPGPSVDEHIAFLEERVARRKLSFLDRNSLALAYLEKARQKDDPAWFERARVLARESLDLMPRQNGSAELVLAQLAEAHHDFATAIRLAEQAVENGADPLDALALLAGAHLESGHIAQAAALAEELAARFPGSAAMVLRARVEEARGRDDRAIELYGTAIRLEEPGERPHSAKLRAMLGRLYARRGDHERARELYRASLSILPDQAMALELMGDLESELGRHEEAASWYTRAFAVSSGAAPLVSLAETRLRLGDGQQARELWKRAESLLTEPTHEGISESHPRAHAQDGHGHSHDTAGHAHDTGHGRDLARLLLARQDPGDIPRAVETMEAELTLRRDVETLDVLGQAYAAAEDWTRAASALEEAVATGYQDPRMVARLASVHQKLGNGRRAEELRRSARACPYSRRPVSGSAGD
ncbi:MAG: tetratricopeptide repeat protein [Armatimonadetes bacterium]|nr:tetratricopeptide repeat protein [Armatimonadota bacterium]